MKSSMFSKKVQILVLIVLVVFVVGLVYFGLDSNSDVKTVSEPKPPSYIYSISGDVSVLSAGNSTVPKENEEIVERDVVNVGADSKAKINVQGSLNVQIDENSEVEVVSTKKGHVDAVLKSGRISGSLNGEQVNISFGDFVVSGSRGGFDIVFDEEVGEAVVYTSSGNFELRSGEDVLNLSKYDRAIANSNGLQMVGLNDEEEEKIVSDLENRVESTKDKRWDLIEEHSFVVGMAKKKYGITDEDIEQYLYEIDQGWIDDKALAEKDPFGIDDIDVALKLNDQVKYQQKDIDYAKEKFGIE